MLTRNKLPKTVKNFLSYMSSIKGASKGTIQGYEYDLILFFRFLKIHYDLVDYDTPFSEISIHDIDNDFIKDIELVDVYAFLSYLENDRGNNNKTRARKIACLKSFFNFLYRKSKIIYNNIGEELEMPRIKSGIPIYLNEEESRQLIGGIDSRNYIRDKCIITVFLNTGLRLSELCSINVGDIRDDSLIVKGKGGKERFVYLNKSCVTLINHYMIIRNSQLKKARKENEKALFISERKKRISKRTVEQVVVNAVKDAGLPPKYSVHKLRHSAATLMYRSGADIRSLQTILGHESIATTQIYTHVQEDQLRSAVNLNPLNKD